MSAYPHIKIKVVGKKPSEVVQETVAAMRATNIDEQEIKTFCQEILAADLDELLQVCLKWVTLE